jgi:hypothetical protein
VIEEIVRGILTVTCPECGMQLQHAEDLRRTTMKSIQVANTETGEYDPLLSLPYPYYITEDGSVDRQDFWKGEPSRLMGFQKDPDVQHVDILAEDWLKDDDIDVTGMFPVFVDEGGTMWRHQMPVVETAEF